MTSLQENQAKVLNILLFFLECIHTFKMESDLSSGTYGAVKYAQNFIMLLETMWLCSLGLVQSSECL